MQRGVSHDIERKFRGCVAWFTGLSGAGKSTVSMGVEKELVSRGIRYMKLNNPLQFDERKIILFQACEKSKRDMVKQIRLQKRFQSPKYNSPNPNIARHSNLAPIEN